MQKLFSYGTLQQEEVQLSTFGRRLEGHEDAILGYKLSMTKITDPEVVKTSGKEFHPILQKTNNHDDEVAGMVFSITNTELQQADKYEVSDYKRISVLLKSGLNAWVYVAQQK